MSYCSASCTSVRSPLIAAIATFALKADVWFRRGLLLMLSPDSRAKSCPLSGRSSTYRPVQILEAGSPVGGCRYIQALVDLCEHGLVTSWLLQRRRRLRKHGQSSVTTFWIETSTFQIRRYLRLS